jgi:hypothetical protein
MKIIENEQNIKIKVFKYRFFLNIKNSLRIY